jgi:hypothetical protein
LCQNVRTLNKINNNNNNNNINNKRRRRKRRMNELGCKEGNEVKT